MRPEEFGEEQNPTLWSMTLNLTPFLQLNKMRKSGDKRYIFQRFAVSMYVMHEYGHYGDKETNMGVNSGQKPMRSEDLEFSSDPTGVQKKEAQTRHRGKDIESMILFRRVYNFSGFESRALNVLFNADGSVTEKTMKNIRESKRIKQP